MGGQSFLPTEILDYVETHAPSDGSPYGVSQRELAKALGYHPCSMSRPLAELVQDGMLSSRRGLVRDGLRRQLVYRLTEHGRSQLVRETKRVPLLAGAIPPPPNPFLGRKEELDRLGDFAREGGSVMLVDGPPGMGKTALVARHIRRVKAGRIPFWFTVRATSSPRQFVTALSHALSFLGGSQLAYYSQLPRAPVALEVADLVARAVGDRELAVVVDDLQMADANMRAFVTDFVRDLVRGRHDHFYMVGQELPEFDGSTVQVGRLTIGGLDRSAAHELTDRKGGLAERFESVYQSTLGSPLLLQLAVSNPGVEADAATLPARVVDRLPVDEVRTLLRVALSNEPLPATYLVESGALSAPRLAEVLRMGILQRTQQGRLEILQVVRTALLARVTPTDEIAAHLELAEFYSGSHRPESIRERFLHLVAGESWKSASQILLRQERALFALGYSETLRDALRHLANALPKGSAKVRTLFAEAALLRHHSDYAEAVNTLRRTIIEAGDDSRAICEAHLLMVELFSRLHQVENAARAFEAAEAIGPPTRRLQVFLQLSKGRLVEARGQSQMARPIYQDAFETARRFKITDLALESVAAWSRLVEIESGPEVALRIVSEALPEARRAGRADIAFNLLLARARSYLLLGETNLAETEMRTVRAEAEALGYLNQLTYALHGLAATAFQRSKMAEGLSYARQASALAERLGNDLVLGHTLAMICSAEVREAGGANPTLIRDAITQGERSVAVLARVPPSEALAFAHGYLSEAYIDLGDVASAQGHYLDALNLCDTMKLVWLRNQLESEIGLRLGQLTLNPKTESRLGRTPGG